MEIKHGEIELHAYNDQPAGSVNCHTLARSLDVEHFAGLFSDFLNIGMKDQRVGKQVGELLRYDHRSLQASAYRFCLGFIMGLADQEYTDLRNEIAVTNAKKIKKMVEDGEIEMGYMI